MGRESTPCGMQALDRAFFKFQDMRLKDVSPLPVGDKTVENSSGTPWGEH